MLTYHLAITTTTSSTEALDIVTDIASYVGARPARLFVAFPYADHAANGYVTIAMDVTDADAARIASALDVVAYACLAA